MKGRQTLIYLIILLLIGGWFTYFEVIRKGEKEASEKAARRIFQMQPSEVTSLAIAPGDKKAVELRKSAEWKIVQPVRADVDGSAIEDYLQMLTSLESQGEVTASPGSLEPFGLERPALKVSVQAGDRSRDLLVGEKSPVGGNRYARTGEKPDVFLIAEVNFSALNKGVDELRRRQLFTFQPRDVAGLSVSWNDGSALEVKSVDGKWSAPANPDLNIKESKVTNVIDQLHWLQSRTFLEDEVRNLSAHGLEPPLVTVNFRFTDGRTADLKLSRAEGDKTGLAAVSSELAAVVQVDRSVLETIPKGAQSLEDHTLVRLKPEDVNRVVWQAGENKGDASRIDEQNWGLRVESGDPKPIKDPWRVRSIVWSLGNSEYLEEVEPALDIPGESHGRLELGGPNGGNLVSLFWEKPPAGDTSPVTLWVRRDGRTGTFKVESRVLHELEGNLQGMSQLAQAN
jgi:hypothetical protein